MTSNFARAAIVSFVWHVDQMFILLRVQECHSDLWGFGMNAGCCQGICSEYLDGALLVDEACFRFPARVVVPV